MKARHLLVLVGVTVGLLSWVSVQRGSHNVLIASTSSTSSTTPLQTSTTTTQRLPTTTSTIQAELPAGNGLSPFTSDVQTFIASRSGTSIDAALLDLNTGAIYRYSHGTSAHVDASIIKVELLEALLVKNHGTLPSASQSLARSMIVVSNNEATTQLWNNLGGSDALSNFGVSVGLVNTVVSKCVVCTNFPWPGWGLTTTNSLDQIALLRLIAEPNGLLDAHARTYISGLMSQVIPSERWGVSGGVPSASFVQLKNGWLPLHGMGDWEVNSIGWIHGAGRNYLAAVLTSGNPTMGYGIQSIERISSEFWRTRSSQTTTTTTLAGN